MKHFLFDWNTEKTEFFPCNSRCIYKVFIVHCFIEKFDSHCNAYLLTWQQKKIPTNSQKINGHQRACKGLDPSVWWGAWTRKSSKRILVFSFCCAFTLFGNPKITAWQSHQKYAASMIDKRTKNHCTPSLCLSHCISLYLYISLSLLQVMPNQIKRPANLSIKEDNK